MKKLLLRSLPTVCALTMIGVCTAMILFTSINSELPDTQSIRDIELKIPLRVYSADQQLIAEFGDERRNPIDIEQTPQQLINAILSSEDDSFFKHGGIDVKGLLRALISNMRSGDHGQGASTITMQVARNFFLSREKTYTRKLKEILLSIKLEQVLNKNEILSLYINKIFLGHRAYGFGAAADVYYGKEIEELDLAQIAMLAGLPKAPSSINPLRNPDRAITRRNYVLSRMLDLKYIIQEEYDAAKLQPITAEKHNRNIGLSAPHIAEMVRAKVLEEFGEEAYWQGYTVHTTIRSKEQNAAQQSLRKGLQSYDRRHGWRGAIANIDLKSLDEETAVDDILIEFPTSGKLIPALVTTVSKNTAGATTKNGESIELKLKNSLWARKHLTDNHIGDKPTSMKQLISSGDVIYVKPEESADKTSWLLSQIPNIGGALVSTEAASGKILSLVGGYDFFLNKYNRATQSIRQPGSNIKPFIYSASLDKGFNLASVISGAPITERDPTHGTMWRPQNYSGKFFGPTRMRLALSKSMNLVSVRLLRSIGIPYTIDYLQRFGIDTSRFAPTLTMALGAGGITPLEMLTAYSSLANGGYKIKPYFIDYIADRHGDVVYQSKVPVFCDSCYDDRYEGSDLDEITVPETPSLESLRAAALQAEENGEPQTYIAPRIMNVDNHFLTVSMLKEVIKTGTGRKALVLEREDLAGKTGTTNDYVDAWFSGFNPKIATTVWVGFDQPRSMGRGEAGGVAALPIWIDYMRTALKGMDNLLPTIPETIETRLINSRTGKASDEFDPDAIEEYFAIDLLSKKETHRDDKGFDVIDYDPLKGENSVDPDLPTQPIEENIDTEGLF